MAISNQEREAFLRRMGWSPDMADQEKKRLIEQDWADDDDIEYAIAMGG